MAVLSFSCCCILTDYYFSVVACFSAISYPVHASADVARYSAVSLMQAGLVERLLLSVAFRKAADAFVNKGIFALSTRTRLKPDTQ